MFGDFTSSSYGVLFPLLHSVVSFPFDFVQKVVVTLVKMVNTDVAILSTAGVALARGVDGDGVEGTEVASHATNLVLEDLVVETGFEFTLSSGSTGDIHGGLTTAQDNKVLLGGDGGAVQGSIGDVVLQHGEIAGSNELCQLVSILLTLQLCLLVRMVVTYLGGLVLASSDEVGAVGSPLQVDNGLVEFVDGDVIQEVAGLAVVLADTTILVSSNDVLAHVAPSCNRGLGFVADNGQSLLVALLGLDVGVDIDDDNVTQVAHALFRDTEKPGAILVELDTLDGGGELPDLEALAALDVPEADGVIGRTRGDHG